MIIFGLVTLNKSMTSGTVVTLNNLPSFVLKLTIFSRLRLEKIISFKTSLGQII